MPKMQYTDEQMTDWISGVDVPIRSGHYEIKLRNSPQIVNGLFADGRWQLEFAGGLSTLSFTRQQFQWRGLNFEPKHEPRSSSGFNELIFDCRRSDVIKT